MSHPVLPPSRFGAGYTTGAQTPQAASAGPTYSATSAMTSAPAIRINPTAVAAFVLAVLFGPFLIVVTIPMALSARSQCRKFGDSGTALANAALIVSAIYAVLGAVVLILALVVVR